MISWFLAIVLLCSACGTADSVSTVSSSEVEENQLSFDLYLRTAENSDSRIAGAQGWSANKDSVRFAEPSQIRFNEFPLHEEDGPFELRGTSYSRAFTARFARNWFNWQRHDGQTAEWAVDVSKPVWVKRKQRCVSLLTDTAIRITVEAPDLEADEWITVIVDDGVDTVDSRVGDSNEVTFSEADLKELNLNNLDVMAIRHRKIDLPTYGLSKRVTAHTQFVSRWERIPTGDYGCWTL